MLIDDVSGVSGVDGGVDWDALDADFLALDFDATLHAGEERRIRRGAGTESDGRENTSVANDWAGAVLGREKNLPTCHISSLIDP